MPRILFITGWNEPAPEKLNQISPTFFDADRHLMEALNKEGAEVDNNMRLITADSIKAYDLDFSGYDLVVQRFVGKRLEDIEKENKALTAFLNNFDIPVINSIQATLFSEDKITCYNHFTNQGLLTPKTILASEIKHYLSESEFKQPQTLVVKPLVGWAAKNISFLSIDKINQDADYIVQPQVNVKNCYRVICTMNKIISIYPKEKVNLIHKGIDPKKVLLKENLLFKPLSEMALQMIHGTPLFYCGADILVDDENQLFALELNAVPGLPRKTDANKLSTEILRYKKK